MILMRRAACWGLALVLAGAAGCASGAARIGPRPPQAYETVGKARGGACGLLLFGAIPLGVNDRTERAYAQAVSSGTSLVDTRLQHQWWFIPYVGTLLCSVVEGTEVR